MCTILLLGTILTGLAMAVNTGLGFYLIKVGRQQKSLILEADGKHVLTDAWTSMAAIGGLLLAYLTGWLYWDSILALVAGIHILYSGFGLIRESVQGLMDEADPEQILELESILREEATAHGAEFHELKYRDLGNVRWVDVHLLFEDEMPLKEAHALATEIEGAVMSRLDGRVFVNSHLEPKGHSRGMHEGAAHSLKEVQFPCSPIL